MTDTDLGLLGVGSGVVKAPWVGMQQYRYTEEEPPEPIDDTDPRDKRLVNEKVAELAAQTVGYSQDVDLPSIPANTRQAVDIAVTSPGKVQAGDYVLWLGSDSLPSGLEPMPGFPALADDTIRIYVDNVTAAPINAASMTHYFIIYRGI